MASPGPRRLHAPRHRRCSDRALWHVDPRRHVLLLVCAFVVYWSATRPASDFYNHFVWQAKAWLDGSAAIPFPSDLGRYGNDYFQDVLPLRDAAGSSPAPR